MDGKAYASGAAELAGFAIVYADAAEEAGEEGAVYGVVVAGVLVCVEAEAFGDGGELFGEVAPFSHFGVGEVVVFAEGACFALREVFGVGLPPVPHVEGGEEVGFFGFEFGVGLVGFFFFVDGAAARVFACHVGCDGEDGGEDGFFVGGEDDAAEARLDGHGCEFFADVC